MSSIGDFIVSPDLIGSKTETAPGTDTASSGLNGRLQRVAQRLTSLIAQIPAALGQAAKTGSLSVVIASDDDLQGKLGITSETAPTTDTAAAGLNGRLQRIAQRLTSLIALFPVLVSGRWPVDGSGVTQPAQLVAGTAIVGKFGIDQTTPGTTNNVAISTQGYGAPVSVTRTADTNAYAAGDVIGAATGSTAAMTFANMGPSGGGEVMITSAILEIDASAVISGETSYELRLYSVTPPSAIGDNGAWDLASGDRASYLGKIALGTPLDVGSTLLIETDGINKQITLAGTSLFAYLVTVGAYTPTSARVYKVTLHSARL